MPRYNILSLVQDEFIGGAEVMLGNLLRHIDTKRFNCMLCCYKKSGDVIDLLRKNCEKIKLLDASGDIRSQLRHIVTRNKIDLAYITSYRHLPEAVALNSTGCRIVYHMHNLLAHTHRRLTCKERNVVLKSILCLSDKVIACSNAVRSQFDFLAPGMSVEVVYNGVEIGEFSRRDQRKRKGTLKAEYHIPQGVKTVATIGRVEPQKEQRRFVRACRKVNEKLSNASFFIIGSCYHKAFLGVLQREISRLSLRNMFITGFAHDIASNLHDTDVVVLPSSNEGFPVSLLEGMAAGKAVIGTDTGGTRELIKHGRTGILVAPGSENKLADAIIFLLTHDRYRERLGRNAQEEIRRKYPLHLFVRKIESIFSTTAEAK